jgi:Tol biopolymer transport system component
MKPRMQGVLVVAMTLVGIVVISGSSADATMPGDNGRIAFSLDTGSGFQINTIRPNGTGLKQLTSVTGSALDADWSPDGTAIVFDVDPSGGTIGCFSEMMSADGSNVVDLTPQVIVENGGCAYNPSFFPNGKRIVFVVQRCRRDVRCPRTIWSMNLHGGDRREILRQWSLFPPGGYDLHAPRVSPDGRTVVFTVVNETREQGNRKALYSVRMNGSHLKRVVPFKYDVCVCGGDWAPDGKRIVSSSQAGPTPVPGEASNLFTVRPDGTGLRYLTHSNDTAVFIAVGSYSPNGRWIAYKLAVDGKNRLMTIHPSGLGKSRIATLPANFLGRDWGPRASDGEDRRAT